MTKKDYTVLANFLIDAYKMEIIEEYGQLRNINELLCNYLLKYYPNFNPYKFTKYIEKKLKEVGVR
jgi:hypothetical protein